MNTEAIWHVVLDDMAFWAPTLLITGVGAAIGAVTGLILRRRNGSARKAFLVGWISGATLTFSAWRFVPRESLPLLFYDSDYELVGTGFWAITRFFAEQYVPAMAIGAFAALGVASLTAILCRVTPQRKATEHSLDY